MLLSVHAIWGSASTPTAEYQRRRPRLAGDRAGKHNRQFIGALVERFRHFNDLFLHLVALPATSTDFRVSLSLSTVTTSSLYVDSSGKSAPNGTPDHDTHSRLALSTFQ